MAKVELKYMRAFAQAWPEEPIVQEALAQITWYHNLAQFTIGLRTDYSGSLLHGWWSVQDQETSIPARHTSHRTGTTPECPRDEPTAMPHPSRRTTSPWSVPPPTSETSSPSTTAPRSASGPSCTAATAPTPPRPARSPASRTRPGAA